MIRRTWHPHYERIPARRRCPPPLSAQIWDRLFPPSYRCVPWPLPDDWGREWQRRQFLRRNGIPNESGRPALFIIRDVVVTAAACAVLIAVLTAASRVWAWGHL